MAGCAELIFASTTEEEGNRAAKHAFPVNKLVTVLLAHPLAQAKLVICTGIAKQILLLHGALGLHRLAAVFHAAKVWLLALGAKIVGAIVRGKACQIVVVDVALGNDAAFLVTAFFCGLIDLKLLDFCFETECLVDQLRKLRDHLRFTDRNFLFARRAIQVSE